MKARATAYFVAGLMIRLLHPLAARAAEIPYQTTVGSLLPALYWRLSEPSGTENADASGNAHPGRVTGAVTLNAPSLLKGDPDPSADFSGGYVRSEPFATTNTGITLAALISIKEGINNLGSAIVTVGPYSNGEGFHSLQVGAKRDLRYDYCSDRGAVQSGTGVVLTPDRTYLVVATHDYEQNTFKIYLDGLLRYTATGQNAALPVDNQYVQAGDTAYHGRIDEVGVWLDTVLSDAQVRALARSARAADASQSTWYVSPSGNYFGSGSMSDPLDFVNIMESGLPAPGDTIVLRGGDHTGGAECRLQGTSAAHITVTNQDGEHARVLRPAGATNLDVPTSAAYIDFVGKRLAHAGGVTSLEFLNTGTNRETTYPGDLTAVPETEVDGRSLYDNINCLGRDIRFINVILRDASSGVYYSGAAINGEVYGCLLFNNGWAGPVINRGHGDGWYMQNQNDGVNQRSQKKIRNNIAFNNFAYNGHCFGKDAYTDNFLIEDNILFGAGAPEFAFFSEATATAGTGSIAANGTELTATRAMFAPGDMVSKMVWIEGAGWLGKPHVSLITQYVSPTKVIIQHPAPTGVTNANIRSFVGRGKQANNFLGSEKVPSHDIVYRSNVSYQPDDGSRVDNVDLGYIAPNNGEVRVTDNYIAGGTVALSLTNWHSVLCTGNTAINFYEQGTTFTLANQIVTDTGATPQAAGYSYTVDSNTYYSTDLPCQKEVRPFQSSGIPSVCPDNVLSFRAWQGAGWDAMGSFTAGKPTRSQVFVKPNEYQPGCAHIAVFNWAIAPSVPLDLSLAGLVSGQGFEIRNVQNLYESVVYTGTFNPASPVISLPMNDTSLLKPAGFTRELFSTMPEFGAFLLLPYPIGSSARSR